MVLLAFAWIALHLDRRPPRVNTELSAMRSLA
jgi:hypothetical protein